MTGAEYLEFRLRHLSDELSRLATEVEFDAEDPWRYVRDAAALLERFLKSCALRRPPSDRKLYNLIEALEFDGVDETIRSDLHAVRVAANAGKHDSSRYLTIIDGVQLVAAATSAVVSLVASGIPELSNQYRAEYRRQYIIGVYDHFASGETEFAVFLAAYPPQPTDHIGYGPPIIESFQCQYSAENAIRDALERTGRAVFNGGVSKDVETALRQDDEFAFAWLWEGGHQDLVAAFAPHQHLMDLIPGLLRGDHFESVLSSTISAAVEVARPFEWADLILKTSADYGISRQGTHTLPIAEAVAELVASVSEEVVLGGPRWFDAARFNLLMDDAIVVSNKIPVAVLADGTLAVLLQTHGHGVTLHVMEDRDMVRPKDPLPPGI